MPPISLKTYQQTALDTLAAFARAARVKGPVSAFSELAGRALSGHLEYYRWLLVVFSSETGTGSRQENASRREIVALFRSCPCFRCLFPPNPP